MRSITVVTTDATVGKPTKASAGADSRTANGGYPRV